MPQRSGRRTLLLGALVASVALAATITGAAGAGPAAPGLLSPATGESVDTLPAFAWTAVSGADHYEFEFSADPGFNSDIANISTRNTRASLPEVVANGEYWWRVRAITAAGALGAWSTARSLTMAWTAQPALLTPADGATLVYPDDDFRLKWNVVPGAAKYLVKLATDPELGSVVFAGGPVETSATSFTLTAPLAPGTYYWSITPLDAEGHAGTPSATASFEWAWPSGTTPTITDMAAAPEVYDPLFSWTRVEGASGYEVEVNASSDWAAGSKVCCTPLRSGTTMSTLGLSLAPLVLLDNNTYYWRVRPLDPSGNAGDWSVGPSFTKTFANVPVTQAPSVKNLRLRDHAADPYDGQDPSTVPYPVTTGTPILTWDPVPGAARYEVDVTLFVDGACDWARNQFDHWVKEVTGPAWTPLGWGWNNVKPYPSDAPVASEITHLTSGSSYCARVRPVDGPSSSAGPTVNGDWTYLPQNNTPAFTWSGIPAGTCSPCSMSDGAYLLPQRGSTAGRMPLFTWTPLAGAQGYYVLVARDPSFTNIVDYAYTRIPAYAPRTGTATRSYPDELTSYYWAVLPASGTDGSGVSANPLDGNPPAFQKQAAPPALLAPEDGATSNGPTTFSWTLAEGARRYRLEVATDANFSTVIDAKSTDSTAYTSTTTYPANKTLYWRVRAEMESASAYVALTWSPTRTFQKQLPAPVPDAGNPTTGALIPTWSWSSVPGAVSYDVHVEESDGDQQTISNVPSHAFTPTKMTGLGIFHLQVRANFPTESGPTVDGPYSPLMTFARTMPEPAGPSSSLSANHLLLSWLSRAGAESYRVQVSTRPDFGTQVETVNTQGTSYAPLLKLPAYIDGGPLYWRVAVVDADANRGDYSAAQLVGLIRTMRMQAMGTLWKRRKSTLLVLTRTSTKGIPGVSVRVWGAGLTARVKKTTSDGRVEFRLTPRRKGTVYIRATKAGYRVATARVAVRVLR